MRQWTLTRRAFIKSGAVSAELTAPRLVVERCRDHLLVGLKLVDYPNERELSALEYRRYAAVIGAELRYVPTSAELDRFMQDMKEASLEDEWDMSLLGGHREVEFLLAKKRLYGRFDPISESWLRTIVPAPVGKTLRLSYDPDMYRNTV